jgi:hypothetical protein
MTTKKISIVHRPAEPEVYIVLHTNIQDRFIGNVFTCKHEALEDAGTERGYVVITRDLEVKGS